MNKRNSFLNVSVSMGFRLLTLVLSVLTRRLLIRTFGNEVNGLNSLYLSVVGFLSVTELGIGSAITFCMYKPASMGDQDQMSALYHLFRKGYLVIGSIIFLVGLLMVPLLPHLVKDYARLHVNFQETFILMLLSIVLTYVFSAKNALFNAYKNYYISTAITSGGIVLQYVLQIAVLLMGGSFTAYLLCRIIAVLFQWCLTEIIAGKKYRSIIATVKKVDENTKEALSKSIRAMFMHKIGTVLVNKVDGIIISAFVGVVALGEYSNYETIQAAMMTVLQMLFTSLTSTIGHLYIKESRETSRRYCEAFHFMNFALGTVFFLGYYSVIDELIALLFGSGLVCNRSISFVITLNGFIQFMRRSVLMFRDATGTFYNDRWKPLLEGVVNIVLSILLVHWTGVVGVILATILTNLLICNIIEPYILYKNAFDDSPRQYYVRNYGYIAFFAVMMWLVDVVILDTGSDFMRLFANGGISLIVSTLFIGCAFAVEYKKNMYNFKLFIGKEHGNEQ